MEAKPADEATIRRLEQDNISCQLPLFDGNAQHLLQNRCGRLRDRYLDRADIWKKSKGKWKFLGVLEK